MPQHKDILIQYSVEKSKQALMSAKNNIQNNDLLDAQNRIYYAIFYIVLALAYMDEFTTGKHHQLMGWFNKKYIHEIKVFDKTLSKIYQRLLFNREKFDYDVTKFPEKTKTIQDLEDAKFFVTEVNKYIAKSFQTE